MSVLVESYLFGDARPSERVFPDIRTASVFVEDIFRDGGDARIVKVIR